MDELRFKNALRCQAGYGKDYCKHCPYQYPDGNCDTFKIAQDAIDYIKTLEETVNILQRELENRVVPGSEVT